MNHTPHLRAPVAKKIDDLIGLIPDFPKPGILFRDVGPLLRDAAAFQAVVDALCAPYLPTLQEAAAEDGLAATGSFEISQDYAFPARTPTHIVGIESRGFIFGAAVANSLEIGFIPLRKAGKLPGKTDQVSYALEYGEAVLELQLAVLEPGNRVVIIDDLLATGGTAVAAGKLVRRQGADVLGFDFVIELAGLGGRRLLEQQFPGDLPKINSLFTY